MRPPELLGRAARAARALSGDLALAARRFPLPLGAAALACLGGIVLVHEPVADRFDEVIGRAVIWLALGGFWVLVVDVAVAGLGLARLTRSAALISGLALLALAVLQAPFEHPLEANSGLFLLAASLPLLLMAAPFGRTSSNETFWRWNRDLWSGTGVAFGVVLVMVLGVFGVFWALELLFRLEVPGTLYSDAGILGFGLLWPWLLLVAVPPLPPAPAGRLTTAPLRLVVGNLLVPLALVYLLILYAYIARVLLTLELPRGQAAIVAGLYLSLGVAVWLMAWPLHREPGVPARWFVRLFFPALLAPLVLLVIALWIRVEAYGVTVPRYLLAVLALWLSAIALYVVIVRSHRLQVIPLSLAVLLLIGSFGPWSARAVSVRSQLNELGAVVRQAGLLEAGQLTPATAPPPAALARRISSIVGWLVSHDARDRLIEWLAERDLEVAADARDASTIVAALGIDYLAPGPLPVARSFGVPPGTSLDITGFQELWRLDVGPVPAGETWQQRLDSRMGPLLLSFADGVLTLSGADGARLDWLLDPVLRQVLEAEETGPATLDGVFGPGRARLYLTSLYGEPDEDGIALRHASVFLLLGSGPVPALEP